MGGSTNREIVFTKESRKTHFKSEKLVFLLVFHTVGCKSYISRTLMCLACSNVKCLGL